MRALTLVVSFLLVIAMSSGTQAQRPAPDLSPGVSESLAVERAGRVSDLRYSIALDIPPNRGDRIPGRATISFSLSEARTPLALDFEPNGMGSIRRVSVG